MAASRDEQERAVGVLLDDPGDWTLPSIPDGIRHVVRELLELGGIGKHLASERITGVLDPVRPAPGDANREQRVGRIPHRRLERRKPGGRLFPAEDAATPGARGRCIAVIHG